MHLFKALHRTIALSTHSQARSLCDDPSGSSLHLRNIFGVLRSRENLKLIEGPPSRENAWLFSLSGGHIWQNDMVIRTTKDLRKEANFDFVGNGGQSRARTVDLLLVRQAL